jgi:hypothetical protein
MGARSVVAVVLAVAQCLVAACGSSQGAQGVTGDGGAEASYESGDLPGDGPGSPSAGDGGSLAAACGDFYDALIGCSLAPAAEADHDRPRFTQFCENQGNLPGSTTTVAVIETCAQAFKADCSTSCELPNVGTLPAGAPCNDGFDLQCQSGVCVTQPQGDGGYSACGTCASASAVGQPCSLTAPVGYCAPGSYCGPGPSSTCVAYGTAGAACSSDLLCASTDFFCSPSSHVCTAKVAVGAACASDIECANSLPCVAGTCAARAAAGASCTPTGEASPCLAGLTCDATLHECVAPTVQPGGACGPGMLCLIGDCSAAGTCPVLVPDGQPCPSGDTAVSDLEASCDYTGICAIPGTPICR